MQFTPKTEEQIADERLWAEGEYDFQITWGMDKVSKSGNDMIELEIMVYNADGHFITVRDYLMEKMMYKLAHAAKACGLGNEYNSGSLEGEMFSGKSGRLKLGKQEGKDGYGPKNVVKDYIVDGPSKKETPVMDRKAEVKTSNGFTDDEIPF